MKEIFLSFRPEYFKPLLCGIKKYEYRKRFCDEETKTYLYLSGKSRQVIGIMELGRPICLDLTKEDYLNYPETLNRVNQIYYDNLAMSVSELEKTEEFKKIHAENINNDDYKKIKF